MKWRSGPVLSAGSALCTGGWCGIYDVSTNYTGVLADLQTCQAGLTAALPLRIWSSKDGAKPVGLKSVSSTKTPSGVTIDVWRTAGTPQLGEAAELDR